VERKLRQQTADKLDLFLPLRKSSETTTRMGHFINPETNIFFSETKHSISNAIGSQDKPQTVVRSFGVGKVLQIMTRYYIAIIEL